MQTRPATTATETIVFVDDETEFVSAMVDLLAAEYGAQGVAGHTDPREADLWLQTNRPSLIIADVRMPHMNGIDLVTRARNRWPGLPVIITTAYPTESIDQYLDQRTFFYLPKPFSFHDLTSLVARIRGLSNPPRAKKDAAVVEVLSLYAMAGYTGALVAVIEGSPAARVWLKRGTVVHVACGDLAGIDALAHVVSLTNAYFEWRHESSPEVTLELPLRSALDLAFARLEAGKIPTPAYPDYDEGELIDVEIDPPAPPVQRRLRADTYDALPVDETDIEEVPPEVFDDLLAPTGTHPVLNPPEMTMANNINDVLNELQSVEGFIAAAVADSNSGMALGKIGGGASFNVELAAAANTEVVKAKLRAMKSLKLDENIEDILITLGTQYHLIRPLRKRPEVFFYVALDRRRANLAVARFALADAEEKVVI